MNFEKSIAKLTLAAVTFMPLMAIAQTALEWESNLDSPTAAQSLMHSFEVAQAKAVKHYREKGNIARAEIVAKLTPNVNELMGRVALVAKTQPTAALEDVMRGYIVDASAQLLAAKKPPPPGH